MSARIGFFVLSFAAAAVGTPWLALAEDTFQAEAGLALSRGKSDTVRIDTADAEATYFFDKLPTHPKDYPLDAAQFVERTGSFTANYGQSSQHVDGFDTLSRGSAYGATVDFRRPDTPLVASGGYDYSESGKLKSLSFENQSHIRTYRLAIGAYVDETTAISLNWARSKASTEVSAGGSALVDFRDTFTSIGISGVHLARLSGGDYLALLANVSQSTHEEDGFSSEKNRSVFVQATYYPAKTLGLNFGVFVDRGDDTSAEGKGYSAGVKMFVTPTTSLSLDYQRFLTKAAGSDSSFVMLKASMRF